VRQTPSQLTGEKGLQLAHATVDRLGDLGLAPSPENYELWLAYHIDGQPDLRRRIEQLLAANTPITQEICRQLHEEFFGEANMSSKVMTTNESIAAELGSVIAALKSAGDRSGAYGATLESTAAALNQGLDITALRDLVTGLAAATMEMTRHNATLTSKLSESSREMEQMRSTLIQVRTEAMTDGLTGLANRRKLDETIRTRIAEAVQNRGELVLMMCDIDHFKRFNDTWGHQTGDQIIRFIATTLRTSAQPDFCVARYGGEEFAVVMPRVGMNEAKTLAEGVRTTVESKKLYRRSTNEDLGRVTISLGIARMRTGESAESLIERADACLYASKRNGRNRLTTDLDPQHLAA
jgi:diguanylate cyclase